MDTESIITIIASIVAIMISCYSVWYTRFRKGRLNFNCTRWTILGVQVIKDESKYVGCTFALDISIKNDGAKARILKDLMVTAITNDGDELYYNPVMIFDLTNFYSTIGQDNRIPRAQKGIVPLPAFIQEKSSFEFEKEILFMPHDNTSAVNVNEDVPAQIKVYALVDEEKKYRLIGEQNINEDQVENFQNGSTASIVSTVSTELRDEFIEGARKYN